MPGRETYKGFRSSSVCPPSISMSDPCRNRPPVMPSSAMALVKDNSAALTEPPIANSAPGVRPPTPAILTTEPD